MLPSSLPRRVGWQADPGSILTDNLCTPRRRHGSTSTSASSSPRWSYAGVPSCIPSSLSKFVVCLLDLFSGMQMKYIPLAQSLVSPLWGQGIFCCCFVLPLLPLFPIPQIWDNNVVLLWHVFLPYLPAQNYAWCSILWFGWFSYSPVWFSFTPRPWFF